MSEERTGIYWLASYPKSGNTWTRAFLANYLSDSDEAVDINRYRVGIISSNRPAFDEMIGYDSADLRPDEIERLRPEYVRKLHRETEELLFAKCHDAWTVNSKGMPLFPSDACHGCIYIVRNPLDVCVSFAYHSGVKDYQQLVEFLNHPGATISHADIRQMNQLPQRLLSWSEHYRSWRRAGENMPLLLLRYEDMKASPEESFTAMVRFLGLEEDTSRIYRSIEHCRFERLQQQENEMGFSERMPMSRRFFRKGVVGGWRSELTAQQVSRLVDAHREAMMELGYLSNSGEILI